MTAELTKGVRLILADRVENGSGRWASGSGRDQGKAVTESTEAMA
jgi:hypothetical protein